MTSRCFSGYARGVLPKAGGSARGARLGFGATLALAASAAVGCSGTLGTGEGTPSGTGGGVGNPGTGGQNVGPGGTGNQSGGGGTGGGGLPGGTGGVAGPSGTGGSAGPGDPNAAGLLPLRRLTQREQLNTLTDLLGAAPSVVADDLPSEGDHAEYPFRIQGVVAKLDAVLLRDAAEKVVLGLTARLPMLIPCDPATAGEAACARQFITTFGLKAYRRPLIAAETDRLVTLFNTGRTMLALDFRGAIGLVIEGMLQSPGFLYHWEMGPGAAVREGTVVKLDGYLLASRLSYALWGSMPDQMLFDAAAAGRLGTVAEVEAQLRRLLMNQKAKDTLTDFFHDWFDIPQLATRPKDPAVYPMFNEALTNAMDGEFRSFVADVMNTNGSFMDLLTGTRTFVNQPLAALYGVAGITGTAMRQATLNTAQRSGLLTRASFLANTGSAERSSPVLRGKAIFTRLLCGEMPPPPAVVPDLPPPSSGGTTRQRAEQHGALACTGECHKLMDPLGYAFEDYDGIGQYRTMDNNQPVNSASKYVIDGREQPFANARELSAILAASTQAQSCLATQWLRYGLGRHDSAADLASLQGGVAALKAKSLDVRELVVSLATSRTFRYRTPSAGEVLP